MILLGMLLCPQLKRLAFVAATLYVKSGPLMLRIPAIGCFLRLIYDRLRTPKQSAAEEEFHRT